MTKDRFVPEFLKDPDNSNLSKAYGAAISTCGFELGFLWNDHLKYDPEKKNGMLDVEKALTDGLETKLSLKINEHVESWNVSAVAIHHTHLDVAVIGVVKLNIDQNTFRELFKNNKFHKELHDFFEADTILEKISEFRNSGRWHPTALLRLKLLYDQLQKDKKPT